MKKLNINFTVSKTRIRKDGLTPLICRITYNKKRKEFSTGIFINPNLWDSSHQEVKPPNEQNNIINSQLNLIKTKMALVNFLWS